MQTLRRSSVCFTLCLFVALAACGDDDEFAGNNLGSSNSTTEEDAGAGDDDTGDGGSPDAECDGDACGETDGGCEGAECQPRDECDADHELGTVSVDDEPMHYEAHTDDGAHRTPLSCADAEAASEVIFSVEVDAYARVDLELTSSDLPVWEIETRVETCGDRDARLFCGSQQQRQFVAEPETTYYILVEPAQIDAEAGFELTLSATELECPPGEESCEDDQLLSCLADGTYDRAQCADSCADAACAGDNCDNAIELNGSMSFSGDPRGYKNSFDFDSREACSPDDGESGLATPGQDIVFSMPDLEAGQTVDIDAATDDDNDNAVFLLSSCDASEPACLAASDLGEELEWEVPEDGSYFLVIDKLSNRDLPFNYSIDIQ